MVYIITLHLQNQNNSASNESVGQFWGIAGQWNDYPNTGVVSKYVKETNLANSSLTLLILELEMLLLVKM